MTGTAVDCYGDFRDQMVRDGLLVPMGVRGLYGKGRNFLETYDGIYRYLTSAGESAGPELYRFPPMIPRDHLVRTDYLRSFPDLIGSIHSFSGGDVEHADLLRSVEQSGDWAAALSPTDVVMLPAACYPLYPMATGRLPAGGRLFDVLGTCFRHEPSGDPARMQVFHQREYVHLGTPDGASDFRDRWLERSLDLMTDLGLKVRAEVANDPFFGRAGRLLAINQRERALKYEVVAPIANEGTLTALLSCNCHQDHLTTPFEIRTADGSIAHSACVGFGMERIALALFSAHGTNTRAWPSTVRDRLWP